jgi:hypothetical protein
MPFWMRQRQIKAEPLGESTLRLSTPNLPVHEVTLEVQGMHWRSEVFRLPAEGQRESLAERVFEASRREAAWENAFELFRQAVII